MQVSVINTVYSWLGSKAAKADKTSKPGSQPSVWGALGKFLFVGGPTAGLTGCSFIVDKYGPEGAMDGGTDTGPDTDVDTDVDTDTIPDSGVDADVPDADVDAGDGGPECVSQPPIMETAFLQGIFTDVDNTSMQLTPTDSSIFLERDWADDGWYAANGLPTAATPAWTPAGTGTHPSSVIIDLASGEDAIRIDTWTGDTNDSIYYTLETFAPPLSNSSGWVIQWRARLEDLSSDDVGGECFLGVIDGVWEGGVGLKLSEVIELTTSSTYSFDPTTKMNTYRFEAQGANYRVYINENLQIFGSLTSANTGTSQIRFGDIYVNQDADTYWNRVVWYTGSDHVPYLTSGEYISQVFDLGSAANDIGTTANLTVDIDEPVGTTLTFATRTGPTPAPDAGWETWTDVTAVGYVINSGADRYLQIRAILQTADTAETPLVNQYQINYCFYE